MLQSAHKLHKSHLFEDSNIVLFQTSNVNFQIELLLAGSTILV